MHQYFCTFFILFLNCQTAQSSPFDDTGPWCAEDRFVLGDQAFDGDTIAVKALDLSTEVIRLIGVSAPEYDIYSGLDECYSAQSQEFLDVLTSDHLLELKFDQICIDAVDRTLSWVVLNGDNPVIAQLAGIYQPDSLNGDGSYTLLVNELIVRMGFVSVYTGEAYPLDRYMDRLLAAEALAKSDGLGGWSSCADF